MDSLRASRRRFLGILGAGALATLAPGIVSAAEQCDAGPFINTAARAFMRAANGGSPNAFSSAVARFSNIESLALNALGPYRSKLPRARQQEYVRRTKAYIGRLLADNASRFSGNGITVNSCKQSGGALIVDSRLSSGERIIWRLAGSRRGYRVEDVSVQRIWLAQQLRTTFVRKIRTNGNSVDALIDELG